MMPGQLGALLGLPRPSIEIYLLYLACTPLYPGIISPYVCSPRGLEGDLQEVHVTTWPNIHAHNLVMDTCLGHKRGVWHSGF